MTQEEYEEKKDAILKRFGAEPVGYLKTLCEDDPPGPIGRHWYLNEIFRETTEKF